ncbi:hypothetical protein EST38_g14389 [Candolleomyces aberdarensis]|uniref:7alpha-cephem-methoxylase P8 chain n=1 Tax=Candolleomyces aberdarensis TaxID=2316362 RepID=A0A4Q2CZ88_9AGAR|nr:hypothetical protein EST38_g14389 [Candolleomyces aberdarensis]
MASTGNPSTVTASINYFIPPDNGVRAYVNINADPISGKRGQNFSLATREMAIENVRGKEDEYTLDNAGFQFNRSPAKHTSFLDDEEIKKEYYPETIELYKKLTGASRVVIFDHTIRRHRPGQIDDSPEKRQPVAQAHVDQTTKASIDRVHRHLPAEEAPELLKKRFQIINLWRPISVPALEWPLALCDYRSVVPEKDALPVALVYPDREGETYGVVHNPDHKWKYLRGMTPEEVVLIKCFDSVQDGSVAVFTPHTGFVDPSTPSDAPHRESIEVRALVFYD